MLSPARLTQLLTEFVFLLLGALVIWLAASGRIYFDRHGVSWLALSIALIAWGLLALAKPGHFWAKWQKWNRGGSLAWQVYDSAGNPTQERGKAAGVPVWSLVAAYARPDGGFTIVY